MAHILLGSAAYIVVLHAPLPIVKGVSGRQLPADCYYGTPTRGLFHTKPATGRDVLQQLILCLPSFTILPTSNWWTGIQYIRGFKPWPLPTCRLPAAAANPRFRRILPTTLPQRQCRAAGTNVSRAAPTSVIIFARRGWVEHLLT